MAKSKVEKLKVPKPSKEVVKDAELPKDGVPEAVKGEAPVSFKAGPAELPASNPVNPSGLEFFVDVRAEGAVVLGKDGKAVSNPMPLNKANRLADKMNHGR